MRQPVDDEAPAPHAVLVERLRGLPADVAVGRRPPAELERDEKYLTENYDKLESLFPGQWVAVLNDEVVGHARRSSDLWRALRKSGLAKKSPATFFIESSEN
jgi:hypothetical protein